MTLSTKIEQATAPAFCNKCGFHGTPDDVLGNHKRPKTGELCPYLAAQTTRQPAPDVVDAIPVGFYQWLYTIERDVRVWDLTPNEIRKLQAALQARPDAALMEEAAERIAKHIAKEESARCKTLDGALNHQENWKRLLPEARAIIEASGLSALRAHDDTLEDAVIERCAQVCENIYDDEGYAAGDWPTPEQCAKGIRSLKGKAKP